MFFFPSKKWECLKKGLSKNRVYIYRCLPQIRWLIMILRYVSYEDHHFGVYPVFRPKHPETFDDLKREPGGFWWQAAEISGETPFRRHHQGGCKEKHEGAHLPGHFSTRSKSGTICICRSRFLSRFLVLCGVILPIHPGTIFGAWISMEFPWASPCVLPFFPWPVSWVPSPFLLARHLWRRSALVSHGFPWFPARPIQFPQFHPFPYPVLQLHWVHHLDGPWDIGFVELATVSSQPISSYLRF